MDGSWIALGESVLRFHGQIEPMCFIMPDTIACCLSHVTGNFRPTLGFRFMMSSRSHVSPGRFAVPLPLPPGVLLLFLPALTMRSVTMIIACQIHGGSNATAS